MTAFKENVARHRNKRLAAEHLRSRTLRLCFVSLLQHRLSRSETRGKLSVAVLRLSNLAAGRAFATWRRFARESADRKRKVGLGFMF